MERLLSPQNYLNPSDYLQEETLIASWLSQKKESTRRNYLRELRHFFEIFPGLSLKMVSVGHLSVFLSQRENLTPASRKKSKDSLSSLFTFCVKVGYLTRNPAEALDRIIVPDNIGFRLLSEEQVFRLIQYADSDRNRLVIQLLYYAGLRVSELCQLKWSHFSQRSSGFQMTVLGKGNKVRSILISNEFWQELNRLQLGNEHVFVSQKEPYLGIQPNQVRRIISGAAKRAKLPPGVSPHWLRHCHATHALERGAPIHIVQKTLGHSSLSTTGKYLDARPLDSSSKYLRV